MFDAIDNLQLLLPALTGMMATLAFHTDRLEALAPQGFSLATDIAEWLVRQGVPFRVAHEVAGRVRPGLRGNAGSSLDELTDADFAAISPQLTPEVRDGADRRRFAGQPRRPSAVPRRSGSAEQLQRCASS